jgi:hypothetical protein
LERRDGRIAGFRVPLPPNATPQTLAGEGWTLRLAPGWSIIAGSRAGDMTVHHP